MKSAKAIACRLTAAAVLAAACGPTDVRAVPPPPSDSRPVTSVQMTIGETVAAAPVARSVAPSMSAAVSLPRHTETTAVPVSVPQTTTTTTATTPDLTWTLLAGGDVLMDRTEPAGVDPFSGIEPALGTADISVINVEMVISDRGTPAADRSIVFRAPPSAADRIAAAGVDVANLANNHAMDYGPTALLDSIDLLESQGMIALGAGATSLEAHRHRVIEVRPGVRVAFVGASSVVPPGYAAAESRPGIASAYQRNRVLGSIEAASKEADVVIAVLHWGREVVTCPTQRQRELAAELLDTGVDAIIGHHPHVLQPVEFEDGQLVAYSLGNFIWHPRYGISGDTGVLQIDFDGFDIVGWSFHPHLLDDNGAPVPASHGDRVARLTDIISGDCASHQPTRWPTEPWYYPPRTAARAEGRRRS